ncbi:hypothetical protein A8C32_18950 [Flavivirga aquatica]|uniref:Uncharacterized protein n=1 Tax=Flavivirga aquatica TaxID=1849968 RepID=A0A1E5T404_9FLAO|nr:DUF5687 family protein [Flavivirga aquatica]OEK06110.1 hypothetical protein A8C32_18950 [Flavivirga aquatica]
MIKHFLSLEWKGAFRSLNFGKNLAIKIFMGFIGVWILLMFLGTGLSLYPILKKIFPEKDPLLVVNSFLFYWILGDLISRFFIQKLPVMRVKPLLILPIKRSKVINYVLGKSSLSFFNFLSLFIIVPFGVSLIVKGYSLNSVLIWMLAIAIVTQINNFLNFIIESFSSKKELSFLPLIVFSGVLYGLNYFNAISFSEIIGSGFNAIYESPIFVIIPIAILALFYIINFKILYKKLFLDSSLKSKVEAVNTSNLEWTKNFGDIAPFMQLDLKLIWRNKRTKSTIWMLALGLLYGMFFYPNPTYVDKPWFFIFIGVFTSGIFLMNFGQFIPAWDSSYYKMLMSQNIKYEKYLKSKFTLMVISVLILFLLSVPYVYFGWEILLAHFVTAIYNVGVNTHVIMYGGAYNRKKINLDEKATFNYQGTGVVQWLIGIPLMVMPALIFGVFYAVFNLEVGCLVIALLGIVGIVFHQKWMSLITKKYLDSKYKMIDAFSQDNS